MGGKRVAAYPPCVLRQAQRLCCESSGLPWFCVSGDGVEDGEELAHAGDHGNHLWLTGGDEMKPESTDGGVVADGGHGGEEEGGADGAASAADEGLAAPTAGLAGEGCDADEAGDLAAVEAAELGQFGDQGAGDDRADARDGSEEIFLRAPGGRAAHRGVNLLVERREFLLEHADDALAALLEPPRHALGTLALGADHHHDLPPARHQVGKEPRRLIGQRAHLRLGRLGKARDHRGIDRVGLGAFAEGLRVVPHLGRIDDGQRQTRPADRRRHHDLEAAGRLDRNQPRRQRLKALDQPRQAFAVARDGEALARRLNMHIKPILRHIDPNVSVHPHPSLLNRARAAAHTTVRVQWTDDGGATLSSGLQSPRMSRPPHRHRIGNLTPCSAIRLTRRYGVSTMLDIACGDWNWMSHVELSLARYIGADVVVPLVERNQERYGDDRHAFLVLDAVVDKLPKVDLIFSRDTLDHLPLADVSAVLRNFKSRGCTYMMITHYPAVRRNCDIRAGNWRPVNFLRAPFRLSPPIEMIDEGPWEFTTLGPR